jgi:DNA invertase Pin-like site-specific DNA recombinase
VTSSHIFFIPGMIMVGLFFGFILGMRAARNQFDMQQRRQAERDAAKAARAEKKKTETSPTA